MAFLRRRLRWRNLLLLALVAIPFFAVPVQSASLATWAWRLAKPTGQFVAYPEIPG